MCDPTAPDAKSGRNRSSYVGASVAPSTIRASSGAGPTPFHRWSSWVPKNVTLKNPLANFQWHFYDNEGSFNGWFDWLPKWMRVGYWSPITIVFLVVFYTCVVLYRPQPLFFDISQYQQQKQSDAWWLVDVGVVTYGVIVMVLSSIHMGSLGAFYISFTGWSWILLTARPMLSVASGIFHGNLAFWMATLASALRFPVAVAAIITFVLWNFFLFPIIYFVATPKKDRSKFLKFNFGFFMTNVHLLNFPLAMMNTVYGNVRLLTTSDLWVGYVIVALYSVLYLFVLDRIGLHFYPIFCPRTAGCCLSFGIVVYLYWYLMQQGNAWIIFFHPHLNHATAQD